MKKSHADMDPVKEIRSIRADIMREFKSLDALCEYLNKEYVDGYLKIREERAKAEHKQGIADRATGRQTLSKPRRPHLKLKKVVGA